MIWVLQLQHCDLARTNTYLVGVGEGNIIEDGAGCGDAMIGMDFGGLLDFDIVVPCCCTAINCCLATISLSFN